MRGFLRKLAPQAGFEPATLRLTEATPKIDRVRRSATKMMRISDLRATTMSVRLERLTSWENPLVRSPRGSLKSRGSAMHCCALKHCRPTSPPRSKGKPHKRLALLSLIRRFRFRVQALRHVGRFPVCNFSIGQKRNRNTTALRTYLVAQIFTSWNPLISWLRQLEGIRSVA
jgi:hypothetical protein